METFELKQEHLILLKAMFSRANGEYDYAPVPVIDSKRPYGNRIYQGYIINLLNLEPNTQDGFSQNAWDLANKLQSETVTAAQVVMTQLPNPARLGTYEQGKDGVWVYADKKE